jgi:hypothetical protein
LFSTVWRETAAKNSANWDIGRQIAARIACVARNVLLRGE